MNFTFIFTGPPQDNANRVRSPIFPVVIAECDQSIDRWPCATRPEFRINNQDLRFTEMAARLWRVRKEKAYPETRKGL